MKKVIEKQQAQINSIIPIGMMYIQYPYQASPTLLWPSMGWTDVTQQYSGLFFRAEGDGSGSFGSVQEANQKWISKFELIGLDGPAGNTGPTISGDMNKNSWTTLHAKGVLDYIRLFTTGGDVRPRNTAIKIWKKFQ